MAVKPIYIDCWTSIEDVRKDYENNTPLESELVYAGYTYEDYSGDAIVVFVRDDNWFENNDGHCSCFGLETWAPEPTTPEALKMRKGWPGLEEAVEKRLKGE